MMQLDNKLGTYDDVMSKSSHLVQEIASTIHKFIIDFDKDVCIVPRSGERSISYGIGSKKMSESYCYIMPQSDYLNLGFPHGAELSDPDQILEGTGKKYRHVKLRSVLDANRDSVRALIKSARENRVNSTSN